jgi:hypothetical protein
MSLQHAAKHLAAHGRGKDTELIHMDKGEIASLQKLALANGGSLTINPQTGLPEAGFLSAILPMVAGAGLMMIPGMQASAAGLIVGGLQTARTGSLKQGIMAGLGAYGGAGLAGSAGAAGASTTNAANASANTIPQYGPSFTDAQSFDPSVLNAPTTPTVPSSATPLSNSNYWDTGAPPTETGTRLVGSQGPMNVAGAQPPSPTGGIPQHGPSFTDGQSMGYPAGTQPPTIPKSFEGMNAADRASSIKSGASFSNAGDFIANNKYTAAGTAASIAAGMQKDPTKVEPDRDMGQRYSYSPGTANPIPEPDVPTYEDMLTKQGNYGRQQKYFSPAYTPISNTAAKDLYNYAAGGPVETMSNQAAMGANTMYPMANMATSSFATPYQSPVSTNMLAPTSDSGVTMNGEPNMQGTRMAEGGEAEGPVVESRPSYTYDPQAQKYTAGPSISEGAPNEGFLASLARSFGVQQEQQNPALKYAYNPQSRQYQQMASGGISDAGYNLGGYSDGGRLLRGPGDGVSDSIPAVIGKKQPARLADGEFVVPARIVSELGNGSTEAGARKLYAMMDRIQSARKKTVGKNKVAHNSRSDKYLPA